MTDNLKDIAESINAVLKVLSAKKLYVSANFFAASDNYPDRIVVEGIKNLRSTGKFTNDDILQVRTAIKKHFSSKTLEIKENLSDRAMYIAVITKKDAANESTLNEAHEAFVHQDFKSGKWWYEDAYYRSSFDKDTKAFDTEVEALQDAKSHGYKFAASEGMTHSVGIDLLINNCIRQHK